MKRWILILLSLAAVAGLIGWRIYTKNQDSMSLAQARQAAAKAPPPVNVAPVASRDVVQTYVGVGSASAPFNVKLAPKVSGRLDFLLVREGAAVKLGEVLARIDPVQIQAQISQQQATIAEAQSRLAQAQLTQNPTNVNVTTQIQQQVAGLASARADDMQVRQNYNAQVAAANAAVTDAQGRIDNANASIANGEAGIRSAQANVNNAQVRYNRTYDIYKQGFVAAQDVDDAKTTLKVEEEATDVARGQLRSAQAARDSAVAQKASAQEQANIVIVKGKADIAAADAKVEQARASLVYARSNVAQKPAYEQNLAALRSTVNADQAQLRNLQSQLSDTILTSPISGFVTARYVDPGAIVSPSQPVIAVQSIHDIFVDVSVPEEISSRLHVGNTGDVVFDGLPGRGFSGKITQITPAADPQSRQFPVRITLDNRNNLIKPGMFARVSFVTQRVPGALVVPREAVQRTKDGTIVTVIDEKGVAHRRIVQTGAEDADGIQIREGVRQKELVVTLTNAPIKDGQKVKIANIGSVTGGTAVLTGGGGSASAPTGGGTSAGSSAPAGASASGLGNAPGQVSAPNASVAQPNSSSGTANSQGANGPGAAVPASGQSGTTGTTPPNVNTPANVIPNNPPQIQTPTPSSVPGSQNGTQTGGASGTGSNAGPGTATGSGSSGGR